MMSLKDRVKRIRNRRSTVTLPPLTAPIVRATDPETSHQAAAQLTTQRSHAERLLEAFQKFPEGLTAEEAAEVAGIDPWAASKRVSDLRRRWVIAAKHNPPGQPVTRIGRSGRPATVYVPWEPVAA
jgi:hypothetical protein